MPLESQRWRLHRSIKVLLLFAAFCAVVLAAYLMRTPSRAVAMVEIAAVPPAIVGPTNVNERLIDRRRSTQITLITSPAVLNRVLAHPEVAVFPPIKSHPDPLEYLQSKLAVKWVGDGDLVEISLTDHTDDPDQLVMILDFVVAVYLDLLESKEERGVQIILSVLEEERTGATQRLEQLENELSELEAEEELTARVKMDIRRVKRKLALQEEFLHTLELRKWTVGINQRSPSAVTLMTSPKLETDGTKANWWDSWFSW